MKDKTIVKEIRAKLEETESAAAEKWNAFDEGRKAALKEHGAEKIATDPEIFKSLDDLNKEYNTEAQKAAELKESLMRVLDWDEDGEKSTDDPAPKGIQSAQTPGARVTESEAYKALVSSGVLEREKSRVDMKPVEAFSRDEVKALLAGRGYKDVLTGADVGSGGAFIVPQRISDPFLTLLQPIMVTQLVTSGETNVDSIEYVKETSFTNAAAETVEASGTSDGSGLKPESALDFEVVREHVRTIAHWIPATKRAIADVGQLRTIIDGRLTDGVRIRLENQIIQGDGVGENLKGILNTSGIGSIAAAAAAEPLDRLHMGITAIRLGFMEPTAIGLHPLDFEAIRLAKDTIGNYLYGPPNQAGPTTIWGLPSTVSVGFPENLGLVGKYDEAVLWTREGLSVVASDSHADFFVRNLIAVLAEGRWAFGVPRPAAFAKVDLTP